MNLIEQVANTLHQAANSTGVDFQYQALVVGVSGGPDSLALLHALNQLVPRENIVVAHLDHGLRPESAAESAFVAAKASGLRYHSQRVDVARLARQHHLTLEEAGRNARYEMLAQIAGLENAPVVAVGHQADDQVETVLMHLLRGSGSGGLRGIKEVSPLPGHPDVWLLRPLLRITQAEIEQYCAEHGLDPLVDETNTDQTFFRNRLRHELLPLLESYNPQIRQRLREMADIIAGDEDLLMNISDRAWQKAIIADDSATIRIRRDAWGELPLALQRRLLRRAIAELKPALRDVSFRTLEAGRQLAEKGVTGSRAALPGELTLQVSYEELVISPNTADLTGGFPQTLTVHSMALPVPGIVELANGWRLEAEWIDAVDEQTIRDTSDRWTVYISIDSAAGLHVRPRERGERMRPLGLGGEAKLKKIMIDRKIPVYVRERWPIVADSESIVWLPGHQLDSRAKVRDGSARAVRLRCFPVE